MLGKEKEHRRMSVEDEMRRSLWYEHNEFCRKLLSNELEEISYYGSRIHVSILLGFNLTAVGLK